MENTNKYYVVLRGRKTGVYSDWNGPDGAKAQITKFRGSRYKSFPKLEEAQVWLKENSSDASELEIMTPKQRLQLQFDQKLEGYRKDDTAIIYCSSTGRKGKYGSGVYIDHPDSPGRHLSGFKRTTPHRIALYALLRGLENANGYSRVVLVLETEFIVKALREDWPAKWRDNDWKNWKGRPPKHVDIWKKILPLYEKVEPVIVLIPGRVSGLGNNRAKLLAAEACKSKNLHNDPGFMPSNNKYQKKRKWKGFSHPLNSEPRYSFSI